MAERCGPTVTSALHHRFAACTCPQGGSTRPRHPAGGPRRRRPAHPRSRRPRRAGPRRCHDHRSDSPQPAGPTRPASRACRVWGRKKGRMTVRRPAEASGRRRPGVYTGAPQIGRTTTEGPLQAGPLRARRAARSARGSGRMRPQAPCDPREPQYEPDPAAGETAHTFRLPQGTARRRHRRLTGFFPPSSGRRAPPLPVRCILISGPYAQKKRLVQRAADGLERDGQPAGRVPARHAERR